MRYVGGKYELAPWVRSSILPIATGRTVYVEPFVGGGGTFARISPEFPQAIAADAHPDLVLLWQAVAAGWTPPASITREEYAALKVAAPSALRGFVGFGCSFRGKWFAGLDLGGRFANPYPGAKGAREGILRDAPAFARATILRADYRAFSGSPRTLIYADPPYYGTEGYSVGAFDHGAFWRTADRWVSEGALVVVSESVAPTHWPELARRTRKGKLALTGDREEVLYCRGLS